MKRKVLILSIGCILLIGVVLLIIGFIQNKNTKVDSSLIGTWVSDWGNMVGIQIYSFKDDGKAIFIEIANDNIEVNNEGLLIKKFEDIGNLDEYIYKCEYKYKDCGDYVKLIPIKHPLFCEKIEYKIEDNVLKLDFDQAGWTHREYEKK